MSISFSGLATGLDTSSWVQSLTALKRAKVETLQSQKDNIITKQETLSGIKNFFNSFRSVIQRVTDVKFGIKTSDIFSKNLAISSNANILTAVASNEAQNGTYNIEVERLATNTKASSGYSTGVTLTVTSTATLDTGLNLLGAKSGKIGVDVGGVERIINITKDETLDTFTKKLNDIGLKARYDLQSGRYFLDMSLSDIRDIDGTGIVNALHLKGVNEGYKSGLLQTKETETVYETANGNTKLSDLGIQNGTIQVSADSSGTPKSITIDNSKTISDFITSLQSNGFDASISSDGYFQLNNANIVSDGATGLLNAFGWEISEITSASQTSKELSYTTVISASHSADRGTLLNEISGIRVNNGDTIVVRNNKNQVSTISLRTTSTIGDVLDGINAAGMNAAISDGIISISNGQVLDTGSFDINSLFNMQDEISYAPVTSDKLYANKYNPNNITGSSPLTYTTTEYATRSTSIRDCETSWSGATIVVRDSETKDVILNNLTVSSSATFGNLIDAINNNSFYKNFVTAKLSTTGVLTLSTSDDYYITGLESLGITTSSKRVSYTTLHYTTETAKSSWNTEWVSVNVTGTSKLYSELSGAWHTGVIWDSSGVAHKISSQSASGYTLVSTFDDLKTELAKYGITATLTDGDFLITSFGSARVAGNLFDALGVTTTGVKTVTQQATSKSAITYRTYDTNSSSYKTITVSLDTTLAEVDSGFSQWNSLYQFNDSNIRLSSTDTFADLIEKLESAGYSASLNDGKLTINANSSKSLSIYNNSHLASLLKISNEDLVGYQKTATVSNRSYPKLFYNIESGPKITENTRLDEIYFNGKNTRYGSRYPIKLVLESKPNFTITVSTSASMTVGELVDELNSLDLYKMIGERVYETLNIGDVTALVNANNGNTDFIDPEAGTVNLVNASFDSSTGNVTIKNANGVRVILDSVLGSASDKDLGASTAYKTVYSNTTSDTQSRKITHTADTSTTLSKLGFSGSEVQVIRTNDNNLATITVSSSTTIKQLQDSYKKYGINLALDYSSKASITHDANSGCIVSGYEKTFAALKLNSKPCTASTVKLDETSTDIKIRDIVNSEGNALIGSSPVLMYAPGGIITINPDDTIESVIDKFAVSGITMTLDSNGRFNFSGETNFSFNNSAFANALGVANQGFQQTVYKSSPLMATGSSSQKVKASNDTKLSALGVTSGEYLLYNNGRKNTLSVSANDTIGDFINTLQSHGLEAVLIDNGTYSILKTNADSNIYLAASTTAGKSNIIEKLFDDVTVVSSNSYRGKPQFESAVTKNVKADENTLLSKFDSSGKKAAGTLNIKVDDSDLVVNVSDGETFGSLINKLNSIGINASMKDGYFTIESAYKNIAITGGTSNLLNTLKMSYSPDLGSYSATDPNNPLVVTEITEKVQNGSPANYLSMDTKLSLLNISEGTLSVYRDGKRTVLNINPDYTVRDINSLLSDINVSISDGYLKFHADGAEIVVGSTSDTSNFAAITGMNTNSEGDAVSSRVLYCVNGESKVMTSGLFVKGNVTKGDFIVGNAKISIDSNTTLNDIIAQINYNDASNATAYWDSITGCLYIKSKVSGAALINIEAGTSNFTDIMGFTLEGAKLNTKGQELGQNAVFTINGIRHTSAFNTVSGDVSGIEGVTINLKDVSNGEPIVLTIEKDKESAADAISDIIDAYNELIENVDKEIARDGKLNNETTLKALRNQIRSLFTGFYPNAGTFKSGASIGITFAPASVNNIRTDNINQLKFDRDKFINAFIADNNSVKQLLIGDETEKGILVKVEDVLNQALGAVTGYFASAERSYSGKISRMDAKIERANLSADRYKASLEKKFSAMETIISKLQNNYSSFLS